MQKPLLKKALSLVLVFTVALTGLSALIPLRAAAGSQYITDIVAAPYSTSKIRVAFHYGKDSHEDNGQKLEVYVKKQVGSTMQTVASHDFGLENHTDPARRLRLHHRGARGRYPVFRPDLRRLRMVRRRQCLRVPSLQRPVPRHDTGAGESGRRLAGIKRAHDEFHHAPGCACEHRNGISLRPGHPHQPAAAGGRAAQRVAGHL